MNSTTSNSDSLRRLLILPAISLPLIASFFYFVWFPGTTFGNSFYVGVKVFMVFWPIVAVWWILGEKFHVTESQPNHKSGLLAGTGFGLLTIGTLFTLMKFSPLGDLIYENAGRIAQKTKDLGVVEYYLFFALFISILHAALEEFFWRYFAFGQLRKLMSVSMAVLIAGVGFAAHHIVVLTQFINTGPAILLGALVGVGGAIWSLIFHRYNSLRGAWLSHMIIDFGLMWIGWEILQTTG